MKLLALDTTTRFLCLGVYDSGRIYEYTLEAGTNLSRLLTGTLARVLAALGWQPKDIDCFACGVGPGSFTGVRIGLAAVKGLSWALKKPVVGIPTLDIISRNAAGKGRWVVPLVDAKRGLMYCSIYKDNGRGLQRVSGYMLLSKAGLLKKLKPGSLILGDGVGVFGSEIAASGKGALLLTQDYWFPRPYNLVQLALEKFRRRQTTDAFRLKPIYLYPKECQIRDVKKHPA